MTAVVSLIVGFAVVLATAWIHWAHPASTPIWPLVLPLATTALFAAICRARGRWPGAMGIALALVTCGIMGAVGMEIPLHASAIDAGDSPASAWMYALAGMALVAFFSANPLRLADAELVVLALVVFSAGNGKVWTRTNEDFFPIYAALAALALIGITRQSGDLVGAARRFIPLALLFAAWVALCGIKGEDPGRTDEILGRLLSGVIAGWAAARCLNRAGVERVLFAAALCGLAAWTALPVLLDAAAVIDMETLLKGTRLRLFGLHPNLTGTFLAVQLVLAVGMIAGTRSWKRIALALVVLASAPGLFQSKSRTAWMAAIAGLAVLALARKLSRRMWLALITAGVLAFVAVLLVPPLREAALRPSSSGSSLSQRIFLWDASARLVAENPITGIGANNYFAHERSAHSPSFFDNTDKSLHPHNLLLAVAAGTGLVGLSLFLALLGCTAVLAVRAVAGDRTGANATRAGPPLGAVLLATTTTLVLANMFDLGLSQVTFVPTLLWILAGLGMALSLDSSSGMDRGIETRVPRVRIVLGLAFLLLFGVRPFLGERFFRDGTRYESSSDPTPAFVAWERASLFLPWATGPVVRSARLATTSRYRDRARQMYERAIELAPTAPRFHHRYALFLTDSRLFEQAVAEGRRTLELCPHSPEEATFRTLLAENLARIGHSKAAREELGRALLAMSRVPARFEATGWKLPVKDGEPIDIADLASQLALEVVADASEREDWELRRRGDRVGRILLQLERPEEALEMLEALERALDRPDPSLRRLQGVILQKLERVSPEELAAFVEAGRDDNWVEKSVIGFIEQEGPRAIIEKCEADLLVPLDVFFNVGVFRPLFDDLLLATLAVGEFERADQALAGVLYFSDVLERASKLTEYADLLLRKKQRDRALAAIGRALTAAEEIEHPPSRVQVTFALSNTALAAARGPSPTEVLKKIRRATSDVQSGASWQLFWTLCHLGLATADPSLHAEARELFDELRRQFPEEGEQLARYFEQADG